VGLYWYISHNRVLKGWRHNVHVQKELKKNYSGNLTKKMSKYSLRYEQLNKKIIPYIFCNFSVGSHFHERNGLMSQFSSSFHHNSYFLEYLLTVGNEVQKSHLSTDLLGKWSSLCNSNRKVWRLLFYYFIIHKSH